MSVYMVRGYHSNSGCRGFLCVHGTGFSQDSGCVEFLCQCTWCEVITAILAVGDFSVYMCEQVLFVRFYNNPAPLNGSMQFHYCTLVTREPEQTTLLF